MTKMTYNETLDWIHGQLKFGIKPGVQRMLWMLNELGNPQDKCKAVHVVGTNGKGSTTNYLQHIFTQAGYQVGTFTSPYIMDFRERIAIDGQMISKEDLVKVAEVVKPVVDRLPLETDLKPATEFEIITTMMFYYFGSQCPVDIAIIEAGLGGLHDSTNVFKALAVVCPSIGLDHQTILGESYQEIASQKAGVLKAGVPFVFAEDKPEVLEVFETSARALACPVYRLHDQFEALGNSRAFDFCYGEQKLSNIQLAMPGHHQVANASLAIMTSLLLAQEFSRLRPDIIKAALAEAKWLGRTELMRDNLMIDGAHNDESIKVLVDLLNSHYPDKDIHILFAAIDTKPIDSMSKQLSGFASLTVTSFDYPNAVALEKYPIHHQKVSDFTKWLEQVENAPSHHLYVVTGSLYFISQVRTFLLRA